MKKETRYYIVSIDKFRDIHKEEDAFFVDGNIRRLPDDDFMTESEIQGYVFTKESFLHGFNEGFIDSKRTYLRIIDVEIN